MLVYTKYLIKSVSLLFIVIVIVLTGLVWVTQAIRIMDLIVNNGISISDFFKLSCYFLPSLNFIILPIATVCSVILSINRLQHDKELFVLQGIGLNYIQIAKPFIIFSLFITAISYSMSFYILPKSYVAFKELQVYLRNNYAAMLLEEGTFATRVNGLVIHIGKKNLDHSFGNIFVYDTRKENKEIIITAESGKLECTADEIKLILHHGTNQEYNTNNNKLTLMLFDQYLVDLSLIYEEKTQRLLEPTEKFIHQLFRLNQKEQVQKNTFIAHGHQRIIWPLYSISLTMVCMAIIIPSRYKRSGYKNILSIASVASVILLINSIFFHNLALKNLNYILLMYINAILPLAISMYVLIYKESNKFHQKS